MSRRNSRKFERIYLYKKIELMILIYLFMKKSFNLFSTNYLLQFYSILFSKKLFALILSKEIIKKKKSIGQ